MQRLQFGNGLIERTGYNSRLQPVSIQLGQVGAASSISGLGISYCAAAAQSDCADNNGSVQWLTISPLNVTQAFTYDRLDRLVIGKETPTAGGAPNWSQNYTYDQWGNRWVTSVGLPDNPLEPATQSWYDTAGNNRLADAANYDAAGNRTQIAPYTLTYDAENRIVGAASQVNGSTTYTYDGEGRRVLAELSNGTFTLYVNDAMGELAAEYSNAPAPVRETQYVSVDHLGSTRVATGTDAGFDVQRFDYLPFGVDLAGIRPAGLGYGLSGPRVRFTGKERDGETGLDYFGARYMSSAQGRFTSADPLGANLIRVLNPQRWNMYSYVVNNPLVFTDPDGRDAIAVTFKTLAVHAGHASVISVHRDGSATFGSFGPRGGSKPIWIGDYAVTPLKTKVAFGSDGTPLPGSFSVLASEVADIEGVDASSVDMSYFKTSDAETASLDQYLDSVRGTSSLYVVGMHDCIEVCNLALSKINIGRGPEMFDIPRFVLSVYSSFAASTYSGDSGVKTVNKGKNDKPEVTTTFKPCKEGDGACQ